MGTFWNESRRRELSQQERALEAKRATTLEFFPYPSSQCKKKIIWSHSSGAEDGSAKLSAAMCQARMKS